MHAAEKGLISAMQTQRLCSDIWVSIQFLVYVSLYLLTATKQWSLLTYMVMLDPLADMTTWRIERLVIAAQAISEPLYVAEYICIYVQC